jgi:hypothetical protein
MMAITRIRYEKTGKEGILRSVRNIHASKTGAMYIVEINTNDCTYRIKNILSKRIYGGGENINNIAVLKRHIKSHLAELGVDFGLEIRDKK